jgi:hypothetical protein
LKGRERGPDQTAATGYDRSAYNRGTHRVAWRLGFAAGRRWLLWRERLNCLTRLHVLKSGAYNRREGRTTADQSIKRGRCGERSSGCRGPVQMRNALRYQRKGLLTSHRGLGFGYGHSASRLPDPPESSARSPKRAEPSRERQRAEERSLMVLLSSSKNAGTKLPSCLLSTMLANSNAKQSWDGATYCGKRADDSPNAFRVRACFAPPFRRLSQTAIQVFVPSGPTTYGNSFGAFFALWWKSENNNIKNAGTKLPSCLLSIRLAHSNAKQSWDCATYCGKRADDSQKRSGPELVLRLPFRRLSSFVAPGPMREFFRAFFALWWKSENNSIKNAGTKLSSRLLSITLVNSNARQSWIE